jgi:hypothetical protein
MLYSSGKFSDKSKNDLLASQKASADARSHLTSAHEDKENMAIYADEYGKLMGRNIIGDDQRLDWIESLETLRKQNLVLKFAYSIGPQKNYSPQPSFPSGNFDIHYSEMKLSFELLHEGQLLTFLNALSTQKNGWYQLDSCVVKRNEIPDQVTQALLKAECTGGWITLKNRIKSS